MSLDHCEKSRTNANVRAGLLVGSEGASMSQHAVWDGIFGDCRSSANAIANETPEGEGMAAECGGFVYFISDGVAIKIGVTGGSAEGRMKALQSNHHAPLTVLARIAGSEDDERSLHKRFAHLRLRGEWFKDCPELREFIGSLTPPKVILSPVRAEIQQVRRELKKWGEKQTSDIIKCRVAVICKNLDHLCGEDRPELRDGTMRNIASLAQIVCDGGEFIRANHGR